MVIQSVNVERTCRAPHGALYMCFIPEPPSILTKRILVVYSEIEYYHNQKRILVVYSEIEYYHNQNPRTTHFNRKTMYT